MVTSLLQYLTKILVKYKYSDGTYIDNIWDYPITIKQSSLKHIQKGFSEIQPLDRKHFNNTIDSVWSLIRAGVSVVEDRAACIVINEAAPNSSLGIYWFSSVAGLCWINLPANMQDLCLLLRSDLQLEADMNPLADTHTREGGLSMKCEESDRSPVKDLLLKRYIQESDHKTCEPS